MIALSLITYPILNEYKKGTASKYSGKNSQQKVNSTLGNLGYSSIICKSTYKMFDEMLIDCPFGNFAPI
jgi:hypothetical protein